jgi:TP901 family phage tail tape measure protein
VNIKEVIYQLRGQDLLSPALTKVGASGEQTRRIMDSLHKTTASLKSQFAGAASEIPGLSRGLGLLKNPLVAIAAAGTAAGLGLKRATDQAAAFNAEFRNLANLNLSRTRSELQQLKSLVYETAYAGGFDLSAANTAFYDVQSITGLYGPQATPVVRQGMEFARLLGADPNEWVAGLAKARANYGFGNKDIQDYQAKAYASLVAGAMTFDQLAKASPVFAGSAAAAGQDYTNALKMFTLFTMRTKSVDEAATLTKSLFTDLTKASTIKSFKTAGIDVYEDGRFKGVSDLLTELNDVFAQQKTQKAVINLKNEFQGSEGLIALVNAATDRTGALRSQLENFANAELDLARARELARDDAQLLSEELRNKLKVSVTQLGEALLPLRVQLTKTALAVVDSMNMLFSSRGAQSVGAKEVYNQYSEHYGGFQNMTEAQKKDLRSNIEQNRQKYKSQIEGFTGQFAEQLGRRYTRETDWRKGALTALDRIEQEVFGSEKEGAGGTAGTKNYTSQALQSALTAAGGGRQQKVINVSIGSLVGTQSFNTSVQESRDDITDLVEEALVRAIYGAEQLAVR